MKRWLGIEKSSTVEWSDYSELATTAVNSLAEAQKAHISDLRVLLDKSNEREAQLLAMIQAEHDARYYRPVVTGKPAENKVSSAIPIEHLSDVETFDEKADTEQIEKQDRTAKELQDELRTAKKLQDELNALVTEQNTEGMHKVEA